MKKLLALLVTSVALLLSSTSVAAETGPSLALSTRAEVVAANAVAPFIGYNLHVVATSRPRFTPISEDMFCAGPVQIKPYHFVVGCVRLGGGPIPSGVLGRFEFPGTWGCLYLETGQDARDDTYTLSSSFEMQDNVVNKRFVCRF